MNRRCSRLSPPERKAQKYSVPRQRARGGQTGPIRFDTLCFNGRRVSAILHRGRSAFPRAAVAARYFRALVPGVRAACTFDLWARHPRLTSHCRCRGTLALDPKHRCTLELVRMPGRRGRSSGVTCSCIFSSLSGLTAGCVWRGRISQIGYSTATEDAGFARLHPLRRPRGID